jgi:hypothetical protein
MTPIVITLPQPTKMVLIKFCIWSQYTGWSIILTPQHRSQVLILAPRWGARIKTLGTRLQHPKKHVWRDWKTMMANVLFSNLILFYPLLTMTIQLRCKVTFWVSPINTFTTDQYITITTRKKEWRDLQRKIFSNYLHSAVIYIHSLKSKLALNLLNKDRAT